MNNKPMKVGFVGCGGFAQGNHIPNAAANPKFEIVAFCDLNAKNLEHLAAQYAPRYVTTDMARLIADPGIELVVCSTKPDARLPVMRLAAEHGKHLFVEKPMAYREEEIGEMVRLVRGSAGRFMVGYNRPYSPLMQDLRRIFRRHRKGNTTIVYRIVGEAAIWPKHHYDAVVRNGESTILHEAVHIFDLLNWLTGQTPTRVYTAGGGNMDNAITLTYPEDLTATILSGDNGNVGFPKERIEINTNGGVLVGEDFVELLSVGFEGALRRKRYPYVVGKRKYRDGFGPFCRRLWAWRASVTEQERAVGYYYDRFPKIDKGHAHELEYFRRVLRDNLPLETDVVRGALANLTAWRAIDSWREGRAVDLDFSHLTDPS